MKRRIASVLIGLSFMAGLGILAAGPASANNQLLIGPTHIACDAVYSSCAYMRATVQVESSNGRLRGWLDIWCTANGSPSACYQINDPNAYVYRNTNTSTGYLLASAHGIDCLNNCPSGKMTVATPYVAWQLSYVNIGTTSWYESSPKIYAYVKLPGGRLVLRGDGTASQDGIRYTASSGWCPA